MPLDPASGQYIYSAADPFTSEAIADTLNRGQHAARDASLQDRGRLDTLEDVLPAAIAGLAASGPYSLDATSRLFRMGEVVYITLSLTRTPAGVLSNEVVATLPAGSRPAGTITRLGIASQGGASTATTMTIGADGVVKSWTASSLNGKLELSTFWVV